MLALHTANKPDTDAARVAPLCDDFVILSQFAEQMVAIRQYNPNARFHVRWWTPTGELPNVYDTAREIRAWWNTWGQYVSTFRAANECNLENPGTDWITWQRDLIGALRQLIPGIPYCLPALSPGVSEYEVALSDMADLGHDLRVGLDCHAYGSPDEVAAALELFRLYWHGPACITEVNYGAGRSWDLDAYARDLPRYLQAARDYQAQFMAFFLWFWQDPDMVLPTTVNIKDTPMEQAMRDYEEDTMAWDRHEVYDQWQKIFGGQGYNPADAFGQMIWANPDKEYGAFVGAYQVQDPFVYAYTTVGIFCYDRRTGKAIFATSEAELPEA